MRTPRQYHVAANGVNTAVTEWTGIGDPVLLLHATGFHGRCWDQVAHHLPDRHIYALDLRFHGGSGDKEPVNWTAMCEDIAAVIRTLDLTNIVGVGHSIGGHITARVCAWLPERFTQLVLIDPVIFSPARYGAFESKVGDIDPTLHPVSKRKNSWQDADEMFERFKSRDPFASWNPAVLRDYCDHALKASPDSSPMQLACNPLHEASIYLSQKGNDAIYKELPTIDTPTVLLRAKPSPNDLPDLTTSPTWPELAQVLGNCRDVYLPHMNHFIPMQDPELVAGYINGSR